jgi:DNA-binding protein H-NS
MAKTYEQIQQQIEKLQTRAKALQAVEAKGVIVRIKEAIQRYGLTAEQLGFDGAQTATSTTATASAPKQLPVPSAKPLPKAATKAVTKTTAQGKPQFSDASGNSWGGRGPRPAWLREALQAGHDINEFRIGQRAKAKKMPMPLGAAITAATTSLATPPSTPTRAASTSAATAKSARVSYGDDAGHLWSGMGPKPGWLKAAIESGKALADFAK